MPIHQKENIFWLYADETSEWVSAVWKELLWFATLCGFRMSSFPALSFLPDCWSASEEICPTIISPISQNQIKAFPNIKLASRYNDISIAVGGGNRQNLRRAWWKNREQIILQLPWLLINKHKRNWWDKNSLYVFALIGKQRYFELTLSLFRYLVHGSMDGVYIH